LSATSFTHAQLILRVPTTPGRGSGGGGEIARIKLAFNPKELTVQKAANWSSSPQPGAAKAPVPQFKGAGAGSLSVEVFLDASTSPAGVHHDVSALLACVTPTAQSLAKKHPSPPFVEFAWGEHLRFIGVVKTINAKYTLFGSDGTPLRAVCTLSLEEIPTAPGRQNPTSGAVATRTTHVVVDGETLASIAYREYRDPRLWRAIAVANGIDDPARLRAGWRLLVPAADEAVVLAAGEG